MNDLNTKNINYFGNEYMTPNRFISYYYQILLTMESQPQNILEIGIGNKLVSSHLKNSGLNVKTYDINSELCPDIIGSITDIPLENNSFDTILAFEILEHLEWKQSLQAIKELARVSNRKVIISVPYYSATFELILKLPFNRLLFKRSFLDFFIRIPLTFFKTRMKCPEHFWEIGRKGYSLKKIRNALSQKFVIEKEVRPMMNPGHYFFVLQKD